MLYWQNVLAYADDLILLAPTQFALRKMIKICKQYAMEYNIVFNGTKSKLILFGRNCEQINNMITVNGAIVERYLKLTSLAIMYTKTEIKLWWKMLELK